MTRIRRGVMAGIAVGIAVLLTGCWAFLPPTPVESAEPDTVTQPREEPEVTDVVPSPTPEAEPPVESDPFAEREQFFIDQQQPPGQSSLVAKTDEQRALVERQRQFTESQGVPWTAESETVLLALALDACETAILNEHNASATTLQVHVDTSPLIEAIANNPGDRNRAVDLMVFGMTYLCPDDAPGWRDAQLEIGYTDTPQ